MIELCSCNYGEKLPTTRKSKSMSGKIIGQDYYCMKCGRMLSQKDVDLFGYELRGEEEELGERGGERQ